MKIKCNIDFRLLSFDFNNCKFYKVYFSCSVNSLENDVWTDKGVLKEHYFFKYKLLVKILNLNFRY